MMTDFSFLCERSLRTVLVRNWLTSSPPVHLGKFPDVMSCLNKCRMERDRRRGSEGKTAQDVIAERGLSSPLLSLIAGACTLPHT